MGGPRSDFISGTEELSVGPWTARAERNNMRHGTADENLSVVSEVQEMSSASLVLQFVCPRRIGWSPRWSFITFLYVNLGRDLGGATPPPKYFSTESRKNNKLLSIRVN